MIYFDQKGVLRKAKSWESWRDANIIPDEFMNEPTEGFVLNKKAGGYSTGWNHRNTYARIYDPRGFEFEITIPNLLFILQECDCSRGKGLEGKFVYSWDGTEIVLLPVESSDYKESRQFTDLKVKSVKIRDLKVGATYTTKNLKTWTYLGKLDYHNLDKEVEKRFIFYDGKQYRHETKIKDLAVLTDDDCHPDFAELLDQYNKGIRGSRIKSLSLGYGLSTNDFNSMWWEEFEQGVFGRCCHRNRYDYMEVGTTWQMRNDRLVRCADSVCGSRYRPSKIPSYARYHEVNTKPFLEPKDTQLFATLESGTVCRVDYNTLVPIADNSEGDSNVE